MGSTQLLDHGYLKVVESWGSDERIIEAARMSTDKGFLGWGRETCTWCGKAKREHDEVRVFIVVPSISVIDPDGAFKGLSCGSGFTSQFYIPNVKEAGDEKLLRYLYEHKHATPFEFAGLVIEVQAPIMVFREWHRHRTQSYNEMSARYTLLPNLNYIPSVERLLLNSTSNKQAGVVSGAAELSEEGAEVYRAMLAVMYQEQEELYQIALKRGIPKELARVHLPVGRYSRMRASTCLRNWLAFLTLRQAPEAQWEIRQYANALNEMLVVKFPRTMELFNAK